MIGRKEMPMTITATWNRTRRYFSRIKERHLSKVARKKEAVDTIEVSRPIKVHVRRGFRLTILMPVLLLALREVVPSIEEHIPFVYTFLDNKVKIDFTNYDTL